ncbi:MAG TPA: response regulator transcription factor [Burkholderiales bacterium]|nr:response regulator transcription factor [Burkholderiales bacterium]
MSKLRVLLADDHAILRDGLAMLINAQPDMEVVAQAGSGREAVSLACEREPDVAVLDITMPDIGGAEATANIRERCPRVHVLALTRHSGPGYVRSVLAAGAQGYVLKRSAGEALIRAIRVVASGGTYVEPSLAGGIVDRAFAREGSERSASQRAMLTAREEEVLRAIAWGRSNKEIANELGLSIKTVESYKATATEKLRLRNRTEILRYALSQGWVSEDAPE